MNFISKLQGLLQNEPFVWLSYSDEGSDPFFSEFLARGISAPAIGIASARRCFLIVHQLEFDNIVKGSHKTAFCYKNREDLWNFVVRSLTALDWPPIIGLSYSPNGDPAVDVLRHGSFLLLNRRLRQAYAAVNRTLRFVPAASLIYAMSEARTDAELKRMRLAAKRAHDILEQAFVSIRPGMSEIQIMRLVQANLQSSAGSLKRFGVTKESVAWEPELCPIVLAGPNLTKGGHARPSSFKLRPGHTIYFDFGVTLTFDDGSRWSSDIQRMGYILRPGENDAPADVKRVFTTLIDAITAGAAALKPGVPGYKVDGIVRKIITKPGYPSYNHATGHPVGKDPHGIGAVLGQRQSKMSALKLQQNGVYTIEPRVAIKNGGSIEEMVVATKDGGEFISPRQTALYLV